MFKRILLLAIGSLALLATSFCVQKDQSKRYVSSGGGVPGVDKTVALSMEGNHQWVITEDRPEDPVGVVDLNLYFQCEDQNDPTLYGEPLRVSAFPVQPGYKVYTWAELKEEAPNTYRRHDGNTKNQELRSIVIIQFLPVREINLGSGEDKTPRKANTPKQIVLDIAQVCEL